MHLHNRLVPRPSTNNSLDYRAHPMANTSQAPDLEGLHREIHGMAEQIRIMNENNARLIQHLAATNPPPPIVPLVLDIQRSRRLGDDNSTNNRSTGQT